MHRVNFPGNIHGTIFRLSITLLGAFVLTAGFLALGIWPTLSLVGPQPVRAQGGSNGIITHTTVADFGAACSDLNNVSVSNSTGGELRLVATVEDYFDDTEVDNSIWLTIPATTTLPVNVGESGGVLTLEASAARSQLAIDQPTRFFEARALVVTGVYTEPGTPDLGYYRLWPPEYYTDTITEDTSLRLFVFPPDDLPEAYARDGGSANPLQTAQIFSDPVLTQSHVYRIEWEDDETRYYIDDNLEVTLNTSTPLTSYVFLYSQDPSTTGSGRSPLQVDWVRAGNYGPTGDASCAQDAGQVVNWTTFSSVVDTPAGTSLVFSTRTSLDGVNWSGWAAVSGGDIASPSGRYLQYRVELSTSDVMESPEVREVSISYYGPSRLEVSPDPAVVDPSSTQQFSVQAYDDNGRVVEGLAYSWQIVNGGGTIDGNGLFTAGTPAGTYANTVAVSSAGLTGYATVEVRNLAPVADAGGPYSGNEGQAITLTGSGSDANNDSLSFGWDLDDDGAYDDAASASPSYSWAEPGVYTVRLVVTDTGGLTGTDSAQVTVNNLAPTAVISAPLFAEFGDTVTFDGTLSSDPGGGILSYAWDLDNDGQFDDGTAAVVNLVLSGGQDDYVVRLRVEDGNSGQDVATHTVSTSMRKVYLPIVLK
jgi:PKD repeat protein